MSFFALQHSDVAFSGGAIDLNRLLKRLLLLLELCGTSGDEHSDPKAPGHSDQMHPAVHAYVSPF
jgi:hypothetical protein